MTKTNYIGVHTCIIAPICMYFFKYIWYYVSWWW